MLATMVQCTRPNIQCIVHAVFRVFHTLVFLHDFKVPMFKRAYNLWKLFCFGVFSLQLGIIFTAVSDQIQNREYRIVYIYHIVHPYLTLIGARCLLYGINPSMSLLLYQFYCVLYQIILLVWAQIVVTKYSYR